MTPTKNKSEGFRLSILHGVLPVSKDQIPAEIIAGMTLAALAVPEVMGYTKISGTPVVTGLYTILIPMALFAVFGSSRHTWWWGLTQRRQPFSRPVWWELRQPAPLNTWRWHQFWP